jgi:hypothetical protein
MQLVPCPHCQRHVAVEETTCPFCATAITKASPRNLQLVGRVGRAAVFAGATLVACGPPPQPQQPPPPPHEVQPPPPDEVRHHEPPPPPDPTEGQGNGFAKPPVATGTIAGTVTIENTRTAINGVRVTATTDQQGGAATITDASGRYRFSNLTAGSYQLTFFQHSNQRFQPSPVVRVVQLGEGATLRVDVALPPLPPPDRGPCCKPYGAPPARRRLV